ncbi:hypothetical protein FRB99_006338 [Tulasnella sp. 403]|nr:hypothetical protein FRB99_006338 [Tulasnella sp. 403]
MSSLPARKRRASSPTPYSIDDFEPQSHRNVRPRAQSFHIDEDNYMVVDESESSKDSLQPDPEQVKEALDLLTEEFPPMDEASNEEDELELYVGPSTPNLVHPSQFSTQFSQNSLPPTPSTPKVHPVRDPVPFYTPSNVSQASTPHQSTLPASPRDLDVDMEPSPPVPIISTPRIIEVPNEAPSPTELQDVPELNHLDLFYNARYELLLCGSCGGKAISAGEIPKHACIKALLRTTKLTSDDLQAAIDAANALGIKKDRFQLNITGVITAIEGVEVLDGFWCKLCNYAVATTSTRQTHTAKTGHDFFQDIRPVQKVWYAPNATVYPVHRHIPVIKAASNHQIIQACWLPETTSTPSFTSRDGAKFNNGYLHVTGMIQYSNNHTRKGEELLHLKAFILSPSKHDRDANQPTPNDQPSKPTQNAAPHLRHIPNITLHYFTTAFSKFRLENELFRQYLQARSLQPPKNGPAFRRLEPATEARYMRIVQQFLYFALRIVNMTNPATFVRLTDTQTQLFQELNSSLKLLKADISADDLPLFSDLLHNCLNAAIRDNLGQTQNAPAPLIVFAYLACVSDQGDWGDYINLGATLSALNWMAHFVTFETVWKLRAEDQSKVDAEAELAGKFDEREILDLVDYMKEPFVWIDGSRNNVMQRIGLFASKLRTHLSKQAPVALVSSYGTMLRIRGHSTTWNRLRMMIHGARESYMNKVVDILREVDCQHALQRDLTRLTEDPSNRERGYSFSSDMRNQHLFDCPSIENFNNSTKYTYRMAPNTVIFRKEPCLKLLDEMTRASTLLLLNKSLNCGGVQRGTEASTARRENSDRSRSFVVDFQGRVLSIADYGKSVWRNDFMDMSACHSFDPELSKYIAVHLKVVRELEIHVHRVVFGVRYFRLYSLIFPHAWLPKAPEADLDTMKQYVFWGKGRLLETRDLTKSLEQIAMTYLGFPLNVHDWRHVSIHLFRTFILPFNNSPAMKALGDVMWMHSEEASDKYYARTENDAAGLDDWKRVLYTLISMAWQDIWGLPVGSFNDILPLHAYLKRFPERFHTMFRDPTSAPKEFENLVTKYDIGSALESAIHSALDIQRGINDDHREAIIHRLDQLEKTMLRHNRAAPVIHSPPNMKSGRQLVDALKSVTGLPSFKSLHQAEYVSSSLDYQQNIGLFLRTGSGKTLSFCLQAAPQLRCSGDILIIMEPYVSIKAGILSQYGETWTGVRFDVWNSRMLPGEAPDVIVATYDQALSDDFLAWCRSVPYLTRQSRRISRLVLDECHQLVLDSGWRFSFRRIPLSRAIDAPISLVCALAAPNLMEELQKDLMLEKPLKIIRERSDRPEIRYKVLRKDIPKAGTDSDMASNYAPILTHGLQTLKAGEKALIYVQKRTLGEALAQAIDATVYHARLEPEHKLKASQKFVSGESPVMVTTKAYGTGTHASGVRLVYHIGFPQNLYDYAQETQRGGRDGTPSMAILILSHYQYDILPNTAAEDPGNLGGTAYMRKQLTDPSACVRSTLNGYFDNE